jgi:hypothetical protein
MKIEEMDRQDELLNKVDMVVSYFTAERHTDLDILYDSIDINKPEDQEKFIKTVLDYETTGGYRFPNCKHYKLNYEHWKNMIQDLDEFSEEELAWAFENGCFLFNDTLKSCKNFLKKLMEMINAHQNQNISKIEIPLDIGRKRITIRGEELQSQHGDPDFIVNGGSLKKWDNFSLGYVTPAENKRILQSLENYFQKRNMKFKIIEGDWYPPLESPVKKEELIAYNEWFILTKRIRRDILEYASNLPEDKVIWDEGIVRLTTDNLKYLGEWLLNEINEMKKTNDFTGLYSRCFDIGIYLGEFIIRDYIGTDWVQNLANVSDADYGQVVIRNFLFSDLNVIETVVEVAGKMREGKVSGDILVEMYNNWRKNKSPACRLRGSIYQRFNP